MAEDSLLPDSLSDNIHDGLGNPGCYDWAAGVQKQHAHLGMTSPISSERVHNIDHLAFHEAMLAGDESLWMGLHVSPRGALGAPCQGPKLCTYFQWFAEPAKVNTES